MAGYFNTVKLSEGSGRPIDLGIKENLIAGRMISDSLNSFAEDEKQAFKESEARRRIKLQEEREQYKFDKEVNTDKALIDFQNQIASASAGGVASMEQGAQLANEYDRLLKTVGEDEAARIINDKAQKFGAQDAKRAEIDPYYRAELIKGVSLPSGNIDPKSLIDLRNSQIIRNETLGDRKEDARLTAEERAYQREMDRKKFSLQQKEYNERIRERNDKRKEEELEKKSATDAINIALGANSKDKDGLHKSTNQIGTGSYSLGDKELSEDDGVKITEKFLKDKKELVDPIEEKIKKLEGSIVPTNKFSDQAYLNERYSKESINPTTQENSITSSFKNVYENANRVINEDKAYEEITRLTNVLARETDPKKIEDTSNEISRLKDSLDPTKNIKKTSDGKIIESRADFAKRIERENENKMKEVNSLRDEINNKYDSINENINKDFGKEITKEDKKTLTPDQVHNKEFNRVKGGLLELGYSEYLATKGGLEAANSAAENQKNMLNKVDSDVTKLKDKEKKKLDESKKQLEDELKAYTEIRKSVTTSKNFNGITVDGYFHKKADKAQSAIDNKISSIQKQIKDINGR